MSAAAAISVQERERAQIAPAPEWIRPTCPRCGEGHLQVSTAYVSGRGYLVTWDCIAPACTYRRVL